MGEPSELDKWAASKDVRDSIAAFIEWAESERRTVLATYVDGATWPRPILRLGALFDEFFRIDAPKLERERRALLAQIAHP